MENKRSNAGARVFDASLVKTAAHKRKVLKTSRVDLTIAFLDGFFKSAYLTIFNCVVCFDCIIFLQVHLHILVSCHRPWKKKTC